MAATVIEIDVQQCIGCGALSTPEPCLGTCVDRRLDLVPADAAHALEHRLRARRALVEELRQLTPATWDALRARARDELRVPLATPDAITAWSCDSCGRIEAPQPCIGVCIRPTTPMVDATVTREHADALERLAVPLRQLAWTTPRDRAASVSAIEQVVEAALA